MAAAQSERYVARPITMLIRQATPNDAEISCDILRRSIIDLCEADHHHSPEHLTEWLRNKTPENVHGWYSDPEKFCVVAELNNEIVGVGSINTKGEIGLLYVSPTARFRGVSKTMLISLENWARSRQFDEITLLSSVTARSFYEAAGYLENGIPVRVFREAIAYPMKKAIST
ncbi:GNAT family N-acetyltransferase [Leptothoe sp. PORK10 BA2]|nr:GNAT family N-acetyltransferase [Leptothoe sp. PORK10 BA2]